MLRLLHLLAPMTTASSALRCPSPHPEGHRWHKSLSLRGVCLPTIAFISNYFLAWPHKKNVSEVQTSLFSGLGGPGIVMATASPGLHPKPPLSLAQELKAGGCRVLVLPVWAQTTRPDSPWSLHCLAWGVAAVGTFQSPGCHGGAPVWKSPTLPPCLPKPCLLPPQVRRGKQDQGQEGER